MTAPRDIVVVLLDSLNRHLLGCYGGTEFDTPNLDRLAARSVRFTNHHTGSLPCMPAGHDLLVGALDFPWRPWGSIEVWEDAVTTLLRRDAGLSTMLVSDHPHLFETGGENYHTDFGAWDYLRGHEDDPWRSRPDPSWVGAPALPARRPPWERGYDTSRTWFKDEAEPWVSRYDPDWDGERLIWPPYSKSQRQSGLTDRESVHLRSQYGAKLSMIDDLPFWANGRFAGDVLYDRAEADATGEVRNQAGRGADKDMADLLVEALRSIEAPTEQLVRLGLG